MSDSIRAVRVLAAKPSLEQLKKQARDLLGQIRAGHADAQARALHSHPRFTTNARLDPASFSLSDAQLVLAREYGFLSWPKLKTHVEQVLRAAAAAATDDDGQAPRVLPLLPIRDAVLFPAARLVLEVGRAGSLAALRHAAAGDRLVFCVTQRDPALDAPERDQLHEIGTIAQLLRPDTGSGAKVMFKGIGRARLLQSESAGDHVRAHVLTLPEPSMSDAERLAGVLRLHAALERFARATDWLSLPELERLAQEQDLLGLIGIAAGRCPLPMRQAWLEQDDHARVITEACAALDLQTAQLTASSPPTPDESAPAEAQVTVLFSSAHPHLRGRRFALRKPLTSLGRDAGQDVILPSDAVSRRHASIERDEQGRFVLLDAGSTNGLFVAGQSEPTQRHVLADGDRFALGDCILCFLQAPELEAKYHAALDRMTERDALTYLLNRNAFRTQLDRAVLQARGHDEALSLLIADVDHLARHNEALGELAGNGLLIQVAQTLRDQLAGASILGRYDGDQFAAVLPRMPAPDATVQAERLRAALADRELSVAGQRVQLTVSIGSATLQRTTGPDELIEAALAALSRAKHEGRNTVRGGVQSDP